MAKGHKEAFVAVIALPLVAYFIYKALTEKEKLHKCKSCPEMLTPAHGTWCPKCSAFEYVKHFKTIGKKIYGKT